MKISLFPLVLALIVALALGYLAFYLANSRSDHNDVIVGIGTVISTVLTLGCTVSLSTSNDRINTNLRVMSNAMFFATIVANLCFAALGVLMPFYLIVIVLLLVIHIGVVWKLLSINDV